MQAAQARQAALTKPPGSLGRLETLAVQLAGIYAEPQPSIRHKVIIILAGDHGVTAERVSAYPPIVTQQMVLNFLAGGAAINVLARQAQARLVVADMGVAASLPVHPQLRVCKVGAGTANMAYGPAMSRAQAEQTLWHGMALVAEEIARGADVIGVGEMGIGNTTSAAAIAAALTGQPAERLVGRGAGLDDAGLQRKIAVVQKALDCNHLNAGSHALDVLAKVGGFEIGGMVGVMLGAARQRRPVVVDGFIATAAAMLAVALAPAVRPYLIAAHQSAEPGHALMLNWLNLAPLLNLDLRLGEGSGAALALPLLESALAILRDMATFESAGVSRSQSA